MTSVAWKIALHDDELSILSPFLSPSVNIWISIICIEKSIDGSYY